MTALQSLPTPHGWQDGPPDHRGPDYRSWETTAPLRAIVAARALGGCRRGEQLQATVEAVCGWADKLTLNVEK